MRLISVSNFGCRDTVFSKFKILPSVVPNFGIDKAWQCFRGNEFTFNDLSSLKKEVIPLNGHTAMAFKVP